MPPASAGRSPDPSAARVRQHLLDRLTPVVAAAGYDLEDVAVASAGRRSVVRVSVDADGGIDLDAVATVSRVISEALDAEDDGFAGPYVLEVGSPGVDRPLTEPRHWRRAVGRLVEVDVDGRTTRARVVSASDTAVVLHAGIGTPAESEFEADWSRLGPGRVQVEFTAQEG